MNDLLKQNGLSLVLVMGCIAYLAYERLGPKLPVPTPQPAPVANALVAGFLSGADARARADAEALAAISECVAADVERDGLRPDADRRFRTGLTVHRFCGDVRDLVLNGRSLATAYPALPEAIAAQLKATVGTDPGALDDAKRAQWVSGMRSLATLAKQASQQL